MDELRLRLEYLETASQGQTEQETLLAKVDAIESSLVSMLGVKHQEAQRLASELERRFDDSLNGREDGPENPPQALRQAIISSKFNELAKLATELESQLPLEVPEVRPPPNPEELILKASQLGREFDELTARSTELTRKLMEQVTKENAAYGGLTNEGKTKEIPKA